MNIYDAVTGVLQQSLPTSETVTKIQASPDGSTLFFVHPLCVTMWDVQTGGLIHTFSTQSEINDIALSTTGDRVACGLADGFVDFWNTRTKRQGRSFGNGQLVVTICWPSPMEIVVATQNSVYIHEVASCVTSNTVSIPGRVWGLVYLHDDEFLVGASDAGKNQEQSFIKTISRRRLSVVHERQSPMRLGELVLQERQSPVHRRKLTRPTLVGKEVVCVTPSGGVQSFSTESYDWTNNPPLLNVATSVAVSLNRNLVVQTKDSIKIFSVDVLTSGEAHNEIQLSRVHRLDKNYAVCLHGSPYQESITPMDFFL